MVVHTFPSICLSSFFITDREFACVGEWKEGSMNYLVGKYLTTNATRDDMYRCTVSQTFFSCLLTQSAATPFLSPLFRFKNCELRFESCELSIVNDELWITILTLWKLVLNCGLWIEKSSLTKTRFWCHFTTLAMTLKVWILSYEP